MLDKLLYFQTITIVELVCLNLKKSPWLSEANYTLSATNFEALASYS